MHRESVNGNCPWVRVPSYIFLCLGIKPRCEQIYFWLSKSLNHFVKQLLVQGPFQIITEVSRLVVCHNFQHPRHMSNSYPNLSTFCPCPNGMCLCVTLWGSYPPPKFLIYASAVVLSVMTLIWVSFTVQRLWSPSLMALISKTLIWSSASTSDHLPPAVLTKHLYKSLSLGLAL